MRLLFLSPKVPLPANDGGRVVILSMVRCLKQYGHDVVFVAPKVRANDDEAFGQEARLHLIDLDPRSSLVGRARYALSAKPYSAEKFFSQRAVRNIEALMRSERFDAIHVENLYLMRLGLALKQIFNIPLVLHAHNVESEILERFSHTITNPLVRRYADREFRKTIAFEKDMISRADLVFTITEEDKRKFIALAPETNFVVLPHGVNLRSLTFVNKWIPDHLLFLTNFDWLPNRDSFDYYCKEIHPRIIARSPSLTTVVVGKDLENVHRRDLPGGIEMRGFLPDLNQASSIGSIAIVPLRVGSGVRIKILELMALGIVVVSTSLGAQGIAAKHGEHLIIADGPEKMAEEIQRLLRNPEEVRKLAYAARQFVEANHSEQMNGSIVDAAYNSLMNSRELRRCDS